MPSLRELIRREETYGDRRRAPTRSLILNAGPSAEIITTANAKTWLRVDHANDDTLIDNLVKTARAAAETWLDRAFLDQTWEYWLDEYDSLLLGDVIELPRAPLQSITSIASYDDDNAATTFTSTRYYADVNATPGRVALVSGEDWPTGLRDYASIEITYVSGWASSIGSVDDQYEQWVVSGVMETVSALYEHRGDEIDMAVGLTQKSMGILAPLRVLYL